MSSTKSESEREKIELISQPKNLDIAFEVYEKFSGILKELQEKFWIQIRGMIEEKRRESPAEFDGWSSPRPQGSISKNYFSVGLEPENPKAKEYCYLSFGQEKLENNNFRLRYGIFCNCNPIPEKARPRYEELRIHLEKHGFRKGEGFIGKKALDEDLYEILRALSRDDDTRLSSLVGELIDLFKDTRSKMDALNGAFA